MGVIEEENVAKVLFEADWPNDKSWPDRAKKGGVAYERYRKLARAALVACGRIDDPLQDSMTEER